MSEQPTRESIANDAFEIVKRTHDLQSTGDPITENQLRSAIKKLTLFYLKDTPREHKVPYQYQRENQNEFNDNAVIISEALDKIEPVITDMKQKLFVLEKNQTQLVSTENPTVPITSIPTPEKEERRSIFNFGSKKPVSRNPDDPYQSTIELQKKTMKIIENWELVVEWQSEGVEYDEDFNRISYDNYLSTHRHIFRKEVQPSLSRVYSQGLNIILMKEKEMAIQIGTSMMKEIHQVRNDFNPNQ